MRLFSVLAAVGMIFASASCLRQPASDSAVSVATGADDTYMVNCTGETIATCQDEAAKRCPAGFEVSTSDFESVEWENGGFRAKTGAFALPGRATKVRGSMTIRCSAPGGATGRAADTAPPTGGLGYPLGSNLDKNRASCEQQGFHFTQVDDSWRCDGLGSALGLPGYAYLEFCAGELCVDVFAHVESNDSRDWTIAHKKLVGKLKERYGPPTAASISYPRGCMRTLATCLRDRQAHEHRTWRWVSGEELQLNLTENDGTPTIQIQYRASKANAASGAQGL